MTTDLVPSPIPPIPPPPPPVAPPNNVSGGNPALDVDSARPQSVLHHQRRAPALEHAPAFA